ncbi:GNAT family N-acetyltransferase [Streptomyces sp. NPDC049879]|uniref:GNAT family N-acetyltransferase n=1 Tax=Streptomyces sp. NPDC049879 TaxID=3365598 RepID=UPI00379B6657
MPHDDWHLTEDIDDFLARAGDFLRSRPALHHTQLTTVERLRARGERALFGRLETDGEVRAVFYQPSSRRVTLTPLSPPEAEVLAARLADLGGPVAGVVADHGTAGAFADAWERRTGAARVDFWRGRLYRLGTLTPPEPRPAGRGRVPGEEDRKELMRWCDEFVSAVGETPAVTAATWADSRFADKRFTFWETPDGTPVSMAGTTAMVGGMIRVDPVYTPARLRGRGYAAAVTAEVSRSALAAGATDVVLFADPANATSNALYRRLGYAHLTDFTGYAFPTT